FHRLVDGTPVLEVVPGGNDDDVLAQRGIVVDLDVEALWLLAPDTLARAGLSAGDTVGVTVRAEGFELVAITTAGVSSLAADHLAAACPEGEEEPAQIDIMVWSACADAPDLFTAPLHPL